MTARRSADNWQARTDRAGWITLKRGNCLITVTPKGAVTLFAPACTTEHTTVYAAKRAARTRISRGW